MYSILTNIVQNTFINASKSRGIQPSALCFYQNENQQKTHIFTIQVLSIYDRFFCVVFMYTDNADSC